VTDECERVVDAAVDELSTATDDRTIHRIITDTTANSVTTLHNNHLLKSQQ